MGEVIFKLAKFGARSIYLRAILTLLLAQSSSCTADASTKATCTRLLLQIQADLIHWESLADLVLGDRRTIELGKIATGFYRPRRLPLDSKLLVSTFPRYPAPQLRRLGKALSHYNGLLLPLLPGDSPYRLGGSFAVTPSGRPVVLLNNDRSLDTGEARQVLVHEEAHFNFWKRYYEMFRQAGARPNKAGLLSFAIFSSPLGTLVDEAQAVHAQITDPSFPTPWDAPLLLLQQRNYPFLQAFDRAFFLEEHLNPESSIIFKYKELRSHLRRQIKLLKDGFFNQTYIAFQNSGRSIQRYVEQVLPPGLILRELTGLQGWQSEVTFSTPTQLWLTGEALQSASSLEALFGHFLGTVPPRTLRRLSQELQLKSEHN